MEIAAAYIHIPFCKSKCFYCDFNSYADKDEYFDLYFNALIKEISISGSYYSDDSEYSNIGPLKSIYIGGGTPSYVPSDYIVKVLTALRSRFLISDDAEITIECNPGTADLNKFLDYKRIGINRISIGLQSASDKLLKNLGRIHTVADFDECMEYSEIAGITNRNVDLMFGLPGQEIGDVTGSLEKLINYDVKHISFYSLILEEGTPFYERFGKFPESLPSEDLEREMYHTGVQILEKNGYLHYEISNLAKPDHFCRQNISYWKCGEYLGFGAGAHSYQQSVRYENDPDIGSYIRRMECFNGSSNAPAAIGKTSLTSKDRELEFFMLGFRLLEGINSGQFKERFNKGMDDYLPVIDKLIRADYLTYHNGFYRLSKKGIDFANQVFMEFV
ncbi:MAG: radical SAM family heme chaperone HemW [Saccharofermentanales bacterium]